MSNHISIAAFEESAPAAALAARLCQEGFEAIVSSDSAEQLLMFYNAHPHAQNHVLVPGEKLEAVLVRLKELEASETILRDAVHCPDCGSTRVEYPQFSRKTIIGSLPSVGAALGLFERQFYCSACHFTWSPPEAARETVPPSKDMQR